MTRTLPPSYSVVGYLLAVRTIAEQIYSFELTTLVASVLHFLNQDEMSSSVLSVMSAVLSPPVSWLVFLRRVASSTALPKKRQY